MSNDDVKETDSKPPYVDASEWQKLSEEERTVVQQDYNNLNKVPCNLRDSFSTR